MTLGESKEFTSNAAWLSGWGNKRSDASLRCAAAKLRNVFPSTINVAGDSCHLLHSGSGSMLNSMRSNRCGILPTMVAGRSGRAAASEAIGGADG